MINSFIIILAIGIIFAKIDTKENNIVKRYLKMFISELSEFIWILLIYCVIKMFGSKIESDFWNNMNTYKDYIVIILLFFILIELSVKYRKSVIKYTESILIYLNIGFGICWVIEGIDKSNILNIWMIYLSILINLKVLIGLSDNYTEKNISGTCRMNEKICSSYSELFVARQKLADSIIEYINSYNKDERFTLLLNGEWGSGKTSLIKAVEEKCKDKSTMIFIQPMMFDKKELLIKYFCERLKEILIEENIYTGRGSNVEKYLISLLKWVDNKGDMGLVGNISDKNMKDFRKVKSDLQVDINKYTERIIVIVDDFDRVDNNTIEEVLMFIREIIDFEGISTILLFQYSKIINKGLTKEYLDKYIDKRIDINKVDEKEMIYTFIDWAIEDEIKDDEIKERLEVFRDNYECILKQIDEIIIKFQKEISARNHSNTGIEENNEQGEKYKELFANIEDSFNNIRLIKKIIREFVRVFNKLQINYKDVIILTNDDMIFIFKFIIMKNLFTDEYSEIQNKRNFYEYFNGRYIESNEVKVFIKKMLSELEYSSYKLETINRYLMADAILKYRFDNICYQTNTEGEKIISEIDQLSLEEWDKMSCLKNIGSKDEVILVFEKLYNYVYADYRNIQDDVGEKRLKKLNNILINYIKKYNREDVEILLFLYDKTGKVFDRYQLNGKLICEIFNIVKETDYSTSESQEISNLIKNIRSNNLNNLLEYLRIILMAKGDKDKDVYFGELSEFNIGIKNLFNLSLDKKKSDLDNFDYLLFKIKDVIFKSDELRSLDRNYIYTSITKYQIIERIIESIDSIIRNKKKLKEIDKGDIRSCIRKSKDWNEFNNLSNEAINEMLIKEQKFDINDIGICYEILNGVERFLDRYQNKNLIKSIEKLIEKVIKKKLCNKLDYRELQILILKKQEIKKNIEMQEGKVKNNSY